MSEHKATVRWTMSPTGDFLKGTFSRAHTWSFDGGVTVPASASPHVVPKPYSVEANVDPEEAFVASLSSCHLLTYLYLAFKGGVRDRELRGRSGRNTDEKRARCTVGQHRRVEAAHCLQGDEETISCGRRPASPCGPRAVFHFEFGKNRGHRPDGAGGRASMIG